MNRTGAEEFLSRLTDVDLISLLPNFFRMVRDFQELMSTEEIELQSLMRFVVRVWNNLFVQTADESTLRLHENLLGLIPEAGDSVEMRRLRILNQYRRRPPFTLAVLYEIINEYIEPGQYTVEIDYPGYVIRTTVRTRDDSLFREIVKTMIRIVPAHLQQEFIREMDMRMQGRRYLGGKTMVSRQYILQ